MSNTQKHSQDNNSNNFFSNTQNIPENKNKKREFYNHRNRKPLKSSGNIEQYIQNHSYSLNKQQQLQQQSNIYSNSQISTIKKNEQNIQKNGSQTPKINNNSIINNNNNNHRSLQTPQQFPQQPFTPQPPQSSPSQNLTKNPENMFFQNNNYFNTNIGKNNNSNFSTKKQQQLSQHQQKLFSAEFTNNSNFGEYQLPKPQQQILLSQNQQLQNEIKQYQSNSTSNQNTSNNPEKQQYFSKTNSQNQKKRNSHLDFSGIKNEKDNNENNEQLQNIQNNKNYYFKNSKKNSLNLINNNNLSNNNINNYSQKSFDKSQQFQQFQNNIKNDTQKNNNISNQNQNHQAGRSPALFNRKQQPLVKQQVQLKKIQNNIKKFSQNNLIKNNEIQNKSYNIQTAKNQKSKNLSIDDQFIKKNNKIKIVNTQVNPSYIFRNVNLPNSESAKYSLKSNGVITCYSANTNQGMVRNFNEDRVSIIFNVQKPKERQNETWPKCSFFGIYDGHGGQKCADFVRDNLHKYVTSSSNFPFNPEKALQEGFQKTEDEFIQLNTESMLKNKTYDKSGSCAVVILIIGDTCYVANLGDSRAILSQKQGQYIKQISRDHKPTDKDEKTRVTIAGGKTYQSKIPNFNGSRNLPSSQQFFYGPTRILPGRLSVSRSFGDIEAKLEKLGGNNQVLIAIPEITSFKLTNEDDFIIMGSDGIYDNCNNQDIASCVWEIDQYKDKFKIQNIHQFIGKGAECILRYSALKKSLDNITAVVIGFQSIQNTIQFENNQENFQNEMQE